MSRPAQRPKLRWNDGAWTARIILPAWQGFQSRLGPYNARDSKRPSTGRVRSRLLTAEDERVPPTPAQERAYADLVERQKPLRDALLKAIRRAHARFRRNLGMLELTTLPGQVPSPRRFTSNDQLKPHIGLASVYVLAEEKGGHAHVGYGLGCSWDEEHGLGVAMHKSRVLEIGGEEVAFMSEAVAKECRTAKSRARGSAAPSDLNFELLNRAVMEGDKPLVKALIAAGAVGDKRYHGPGTVTAIEMAVAYGEAAILEMLIKTTPRRLPQVLMRKALYVKYPKIIEILKAHGLK